MKKTLLKALCSFMFICYMALVYVAAAMGLQVALLAGSFKSLPLFAACLFFGFCAYTLTYYFVGEGLDWEEVV